MSRHGTAFSDRVSANNKFRRNPSFKVAPGNGRIVPALVIQAPCGDGEPTTGFDAPASASECLVCWRKPPKGPQTLGSDNLFDLVDPIRIKGDMVPDLRHSVIGRLVAPDAVHGTLCAGRNAPVVAFRGAIQSPSKPTDRFIVWLELVHT